MAEISFYHLQKFKLADALAQLLDKAYDTGHGTLVRVSSKMLMDNLDKELWNEPENSFLPHAKDGDDGANQPIYLTMTDENPNGAKFLFIINDAEFGDIRSFERVFYVFEGQDQLMVEHAREQWKSLTDSGLALKYWQQGDNGGWKLKAG